MRGRVLYFAEYRFLTCGSEGPNPLDVNTAEVLREDGVFVEQPFETLSAQRPRSLTYDELLAESHDSSGISGSVSGSVSGISGYWSKMDRKKTSQSTVHKQDDIGNNTNKQVSSQKLYGKAGENAG
jgi:hypothetical protein